VKLEPLFAEFDGLEPRERLELLIEFSDSLPDLSAQRAAGPAPPECRVKECQTAVDLWVDVIDGRVRLEALVPRQSPTIRGLMALLIEGINGARVDEVLRMPDDVLQPLGLAETLGMTRQRDTRGLVAAIKRRTLAAEMT
jgi:cysteine desulfuration protein SufE